jgi:2-polyprenyl-6-hydroxyphenyl methylase/3-demethylubiquinone-9 3-methyltransferase
VCRSIENFGSALKISSAKLKKMDKAYYAQKLSALRLERVYAIASPRVKKYLQAEIAYVADFISPGDRILELGCGYGRVLQPLARIAGPGWGVDNALESLQLFRQRDPGPCLAVMDVAALAFQVHCFDLVVGVQNFISACKVSASQLLQECLRVVRPGGRILLSSYASEFWNHRLNWFRRQAREGLLGPIDEDATRNGVIVCRDGFRATTFSPQAFEKLAQSLDLEARFTQVDESSIFCEIQVPDFRVPADKPSDHSQEHTL